MGNEMSWPIHDSTYKGRDKKGLSFFESLINSKGENGYEAIIRYPGLLSDCSLVDIGCGTGQLLNYMASSSIPRRYVGIDISSNAIDARRNKV